MIKYILRQAHDALRAFTASLNGLPIPNTGADHPPLTGLRTVQFAHGLVHDAAGSKVGDAHMLTLGNVGNASPGGEIIHHA